MTGPHPWIGGARPPERVEHPTGATPPLAPNGPAGSSTGRPEAASRRPRTAADLSTRDIGQTLTLTGPGWSITGTLWGIFTDTDWVSDQALTDAEPTLTPGSVTTTITVDRWTASFTNPDDIAVRTETSPEVREP